MRTLALALLLFALTFLTEPVNSYQDQNILSTMASNEEEEGAATASAREDGTCANEAGDGKTCHDDANYSDKEDDDDDYEYDDEGIGASDANAGEASCDTPIDDDIASQPPAASWMSGKWGIGWRHKPGDIEQIKNFNVTKLVKEIQGIPGVGYVLFGLSGGAKGNQYIAPHSVLSKINPGSCPERDLFGELATAFQAAGYKVLCYLATEGPAQLHHGNNGLKGQTWIKNWNSYVLDTYGSDNIETLKKAHAEVIVGEYAERYGTKIDGWWFDHSSFGNMQLIRDICKKANPNVILGLNQGKKIPLRNNNPQYEDFTGGHPVPIRNGPASHWKNLAMVTGIEGSNKGFLYADGKPSLGHMFMPMHQRWNSGKSVVWSEDRAVEWMQRYLNAGGAWTWNVPLKDWRSSLHPLSVEFATRVSLRLQGSDDDGGGGEEL